MWEHREVKLQMGAGLFVPRANVESGTIRQGLPVPRLGRTGWSLSVGAIEGESILGKWEGAILSSSELLSVGVEACKWKQGGAYRG